MEEQERQHQRLVAQLALFPHHVVAAECLEALALVVKAHQLLLVLRQELDLQFVVPFDLVVVVPVVRPVALVPELQLVLVLLVAVAFHSLELQQELALRAFLHP